MYLYPIHKIRYFLISILGLRDAVIFYFLPIGCFFSDWLEPSQ